MEMTPDSRRLPAPAEFPEEANYYPVSAAVEEPQVPLAHYLWVLRRHRWRIIGFVFAVVTAVLLYSLQLTPLYDSVALVEIENQVQLFEIGNSSLRLDNRNFDTVMATQLELMNSAVIAQQVIRELRLENNPDFNSALRKQSSPLIGGVARAETARVELPPRLPGLSVRRRPDTYLL